jgi:Flp pilus assembly protein TadG
MKHGGTIRSRPQPRGRNMILLHSVKRFLASEDGAAGIEKVVVVVACPLCLYQLL